MYIAYKVDSKEMIEVAETEEALQEYMGMDEYGVCHESSAGWGFKDGLIFEREIWERYIKC